MEYSNTGYVVLGLLIEKVTGRPVHEEVTRRIITPLGLKDTYWPLLGERDLRGRHPRGYHFPGPIDVTSLDPSWGWAAGQLVASPSDVNRFFRGLLDGRLVKPGPARRDEEDREDGELRPRLDVRPGHREDAAELRRDRHGATAATSTATRPATAPPKTAARSRSRSPPSWRGRRPSCLPIEAVDRSLCASE